MKVPFVALSLLALSVPASAQAQQVDNRLLKCVAHAVYGESRDEPLLGQYAVAWSIVYRGLANKSYFGGRDLCNVVYKTTVKASGYVRWQYDGANVRVTDQAAWEASLEVAYWTLLGYGEPDMPVTYFCAPGSCKGHDNSKNLRYVGTIGGHQFYVDWGLSYDSDVVEASGE